jgi:diadenosine tetraphosphate (Ap4A) HIT family hydrolase
VTGADCLGCDVVAGRVAAPGGIIWDDALWQVDHAVPLLLRGWLIVKPKRHVESIAELDPDEAAALGPLLRDTAAAVTAALQPERVYVLSLGESVRHVHWHVLPRYADMPADGVEVVPHLFSPERPWECSEADAADAAAAVRRLLRR